VIRAWEAELAAALTDAETLVPLPIIAMTKLRNLINDQAEVTAAGADLLLMQTVTDYVPTADLALRIEQAEGTSTSADLYARSHIRVAYDKFAGVVVKFLARSSSDVLITATNTAAIAGQLPPDAIAGLQDMTVGSTITIQGTVRQVNQALTGVYYYAPNNTQGNISFTVTVTDQPSTCILSELLSHARADPDKVVQPATYSLLPTHGFNQTHNSDRNSSSVQDLIFHLCDQVGSRTITAHVPLFVVAVNQAPEFVFNGTAQAETAVFNAKLNAPLVVPTVEVVDADHAEGERGVPLLSSFGFEISPPVTVTLTTRGGRLSFPSLEYQSPTKGLRIASVTTGQGRLDKHTVLRGALDAVNHALSEMRYVCRTQDGCVAGYEDTISIVANDEGFSGKGGALTAQLQVTVAVQA
jgi:hypothetical protein